MELPGYTEMASSLSRSETALIGQDSEELRNPIGSIDPAPNFLNQTPVLHQGLHPDGEAVESFEALTCRIERGLFTVGIVGLGYVGLPAALAFSAKVAKVVGFDIDADLVGSLNAGNPHLLHIRPESLERAVYKGNLRFSNNEDALGEADVILLCVPTPLTGDGTPDLTHLSQAFESIARQIDKRALVVSCSTVYPGATKELLEANYNSFSPGIRNCVHVAYCPEREDPGSGRNAVAVPRVLAGLTAQDTRLARVALGWICDNLTEVSSIEVAEAAKVFENSFRLANISLVNEFKRYCWAHGLDVNEVLSAAETKPYGFMRFQPGLGAGGHCIPVDPAYLEWSANRAGVQLHILRQALLLNSAMPAIVAGRIGDLLGYETFEGTVVLLSGITYKPDVADMRESPAVRLAHELVRRGAVVDGYDHTLRDQQAKCLLEQDTFRYVWRSPEECVEMDYTLAILCTQHSDMPMELLLPRSSQWFDFAGEMVSASSRSKLNSVTI